MKGVVSWCRGKLKVGTLMFWNGFVFHASVMTSSSINVIRSTTSIRYRRSYSNFSGSEIRLHNTEEWRLLICITEDR